MMLILIENTVQIFLGILEYLPIPCNVTTVYNLQPGHDFVFSPGLIDLKQNKDVEMTFTPLNWYH